MSDISARIAQLSPEKQALLARRLEQSRTAAPAGREPLAVVGMACRFPGDASTPDAYWQLLLDGVDAITEVPLDRWNSERVFDPDPQAPGKTMMRFGGFLSDVQGFDAEFFGISPREAERMDPQQRLLLETAWEAFEAAGRPVDALRGQAIGVFVGAHSMSADYYLRQLADVRALDIYTSTGAAHSIIANRLSYLLDLRGPSMVVDTACSSSLVALHLAVQSLRNRECEFAVAAGVNLLAAAETTIAFSKLQIGAQDGRCKAFDSRADGMVRSEGCGVLVLRRLADALRDGDPVLAVIRGSAINQDGATNGLTAPSGLAQEAVVKAALADAGLTGLAVSYVETHGTGTALGDPIEVQALAATVGGESRQPCYLGAVKTNIGHLESAAGVAGVIKAVLCLRHRTIPKNLHFQSLNPHITLEGTRFAIPTEAIPWQIDDGTSRVCAVSSFGFGGTNAHVVLEEAPAAPARGAAATASGPMLVPVSARSEAALKSTAAQWAAVVRNAQSESVVASLAATAALRRTHHPVRRAIVASTRDELTAALDRIAGGARLIEGLEDSGNEPHGGLVFVYSGQGGHWPSMGLDLAQREAVVRDALARCDAEIRKHASWSLLAELSGSRLHRTAIGQPALFSVQYAVTELLRSWGIRPDAVAGHSAGEVIAACAAGVLTFEDAVRLSVLRGRLMDEASGGRMLAVELTPEEASRAIERFAPRVAVAAFNGPSSCVLSGPAADIDAVAAAMAERQVFAKRLAVEYAFHSPDMAAAGDELARHVASLRHAAPSVPLVSTVTGREATQADFSPDYWKRNVVNPVRFADAVRLLAGRGHEVFVEIGAHPALTGAIRRTGAAAGRTLFAIPTLKRQESGPARMLTAAGALYELGIGPEWRAIAPADAPLLPLPPYPWQRSRHWIDTVEPAAEHSELPDWFYELAWVARSASGSRTASDDWTPAANLIARRVAAASPSVSSTGAAIQHVEAISTALIVRAFRDLGCPLRKDDRLEPATLPGRLGIEPRHGRLFARLLAALEEDGIVARDGDTLVVKASPADRDITAEIARVAAEFPEAVPVLRLLERCGVRLAEVLIGRTDAVSLLFGDERAGAAQMYANAAFARTANAAMGDALGSVLESLPRGRALRVLEIGAGTGSTTRALLPALDGERTEYVFTDVSTLFLQGARDTFGAYPFVRYELLDIERDPSEQGFSGAAFDVVVAANVLHATIDLPGALAHAARLLAPGGLLLILEGSGAHRWIDLTFGLTDGWWRFDDAIRSDYPLVTDRTWTSMLQQAGLEVSTVPLPGDLFDQTIVVARTPSRAAAAAPSGTAVMAVAGETWCVLADRGGVAAALADLLRSTGAVPVVVPAESAQMTTVGDTLRASRTGVAAVVDLRPLDTPEGAESDAAAGVIDICRALVEADIEPSRGLWIVTRDVQPIARDSREPLALPQSPLWGLGRVISLEHPQLRGALLDLTAGTHERSARTIFEEVCATDGEDQIVVRPGGRFVPRLVRARGIRAQEPQFRRDRTYLITGGLGRLGLRIAAWMAQRGARWFVLTSRAGLPDRTTWPSIPASDPARARLDAVRALERAGAVVAAPAINVADHDAMAALFERFGAELPPLAGVVHAAGTVTIQPVETISRAALHSVLEAKVAGARALDALTRTMPLDFFALFSSGASLWGAKGHAHYAAANHYLDSLAHERRRAGRPAVSINWGWWEGGGTTEEHHEYFRQIGLGTLPLDQALSAFGALLASGKTQVAVSAIEWDVFKPVFEARRRRPFFEAVGKTGRPRPAVERGFAPATARPNTFEELLEQVRGHVASVLGIADDQQIEPRTGFFQIGMDSITTVELRKRLETALACELPATVAFEYPNTEALSRYLAERIGLAASAPAGAQRIETEPGIEPLAAQSEEELAALLDQAVAHALGKTGPLGDRQ